MKSARPTGFFPDGEPEADTRLEYQRLCAAVMNSESRNQFIVTEILQVVKLGTLARSAHGAHRASGRLASQLRPHIAHVITLQRHGPQVTQRRA